MYTRESGFVWGLRRAKIFGTLRRALVITPTVQIIVFTAQYAKILRSSFWLLIRGFYLTQDRQNNRITPINPGGQTEILFDCHLPVSLGGGY